MLAVQEYLRSGKSPDDLKADFGIYHYRHPSLPLIGFKYHQIESPKTHPIVRDCRGIVLEAESWDVVAKPFRRFFNAGEDHETYKHFDWSDFTATTKHDGSLIILYFYRGEWHANTSGSFGLQECNFSGKTWRELFWETSGIDSTKLDESLTYVFEMWTPANKVVRTYPAPVVYLLSAFQTQTLAELSISAVDDLAVEINVDRPEHHQFRSFDEIIQFLKDKELLDKTYEGIVVRGSIRPPEGASSENERYKIKNQTYLALHHLLDNGNLFNPKRLVPLALAGEVDEVITYLPEIEPHIKRVVADLDQAYAALRDLWIETREIPVQRDFALAVVKKTPFSKILFDLRKNLAGNQTEADLRAGWRNSGDAIIKAFYS